MRIAALRRPGEQTQDVFRFDGLRLTFLCVHLAIVAYVCAGWLVPSRSALLAYTLVLPLMALQWVLNGGASIVNNFENIARVGQWSDSRNSYEGAFFQAVLAQAGIRASQAQITTLACSLMLIFWLAAICRMILIVVPPAS